MDLRDARVGAGDVPRAEAAGGDDLGRQAVRLERVGELEQLVVRRLCLSIRSSRSGSSMQWPS